MFHNLFQIWRWKGTIAFLKCHNEYKINLLLLDFTQMFSWICNLIDRHFVSKWFLKSIQSSNSEKGQGLRIWPKLTQSFKRFFLQVSALILSKFKDFIIKKRFFFKHWWTWKSLNSRCFHSCPTLFRWDVLKKTLLAFTIKLSCDLMSYLFMIIFNRSWKYSNTFPR